MSRGGGRIAFFLVLGLTVLATTWPGLALVPPLAPYVLGLPAPLAWIGLWLVILFLALLVLYLTDHRDEEGG